MNGSLLFIISGPAGSGKGSVVSEILKRDDRFLCAVSATSRPCLAGEVDGVNYYYLSREQFEEKIRTHGVLEYTEYCGNYYGTPASEVERAKALGKHLILEIAQNVADAVPQLIRGLLSQHDILRGGTQIDKGPLPLLIGQLDRLIEGLVVHPGRCLDGIGLLADDAQRSKGPEGGTLVRSVVPDGLHQADHPLLYQIIRITADQITGMG